MLCPKHLVPYVSGITEESVCGFCERAEASVLRALVSEAWGIIANAGGGDWTREGETWTAYAAGWGERAGFRLTDEQRQDAAVGAALGTQRNRIAEFLLSRSLDERLCAADASHVLRTVARHVREGSLL